MKNLACLTCLFLMVITAGCGDHEARTTNGQVQLSAVAPDGASEAFVWIPESGGTLGATVSQRYQVWLQALRDNKVESLILEADRTNGIRLRWNSQNELEICYAKAQISKFRNFFVIASRESPEIYGVEIVLKKVPLLEQCLQARETPTPST
jgi:hypothetical protein